MPNPFEDLIIRHPTFDDAQETLDLMIRCEVNEYGQPDSDIEDLTFDWKRMDLRHDAWISLTPGGDLIGYAGVIPHNKGFQYSFFVDPGVERGLELAISLLERCEVRGRVLASEFDQEEEVNARSYIAEVNQRDGEVMRLAGFECIMHHFQMQIELDGNPPSPVWPEGISVRTAITGKDDRVIYDLIQTAFERPGRPPHPFGDWKAFLMRADIYEPDLWFLAVTDKEIVGACLGFVYPDLGWVRQLGVLDEWRRKGLGTALLHHAFGVFKERGLPRVGLVVESENSRAYAFYQNIGMSVLRQYDEWEKRIRDRGEGRKKQGKAEDWGKSNRH
jgi:ribosomal protein S18 acetylase RimI-like enzyme